MSARNYFSAREKNIHKFGDTLPIINRQKCVQRATQDLPVLSANNNFINRNISNYSFQIQPLDVGLNNSDTERSGTPFSDFFSESETGTPDFRSEESDSSTGSVLRRNTAEVTRILADEWEKIERTIYDEEGEKVTRPQLVEECKQWRQLHPQLRVIGRGLPIPEKKINYRQIEHDETITMHYSDYEENNLSGERLSQSSTDVTPQNSPRVSLSEITEPKLSREKISFHPKFEEEDIQNDFSSLLQITSIHIRSPPNKRQNSSILKSEIASSKWMRNNRPDSSVNCERNSAKSFMSLDTINYNNLALSASERNNFRNRIVTARQRDLAKLEPLNTPELPQNDINRLSTNSMHHMNARKVSLPPLLLEEEKRKMGSLTSARKHNVYTAKSRRTINKNIFHFDKVNHI